MTSGVRRFPYCLLLVTLCCPWTLCAQEPGLARTPPMGWNSWNHFGCKADDVTIRAQADAMVRSGMKAVGYEYINIDDCWEGERDQKGFLHPNSKFPDMKKLADYIHAQGLKLGIYSSPGPKTCGGYEGSYGHEEQDARAFAAWGFDLLKYDLCSFEGMGSQQQAYKKMGEALRNTGRPILYSLCQYGEEGVWAWGRSVGASMWRTTDDIRDNYYSMVVFGFGQSGLERFAGPGGWNDPDMLEIGNGGMDEDESTTQMSLWSLLAAPLFAGNDLTTMSPATLALLTNSEIIAVDQDPAGMQGHRVKQIGPLEVWMKPLADGSKVVGFFNLDWGSMPMEVEFQDIGITGPVRVRDLWSRKDLGTFRTKFAVNVLKHGVVMIKLH
jgi:alpha-galactosidase